MPIPPAQIQAAFNHMKDSRTSLYHAEKAVLIRKIDLKRREASLLLSGAIIGKNAETRDAQLKEGCKDEIAALELAEERRQAAQVIYELACMTVDSLKWQIRAEGKEL